MTDRCRRGAYLKIILRVSPPPHSPKSTSTTLQPMAWNISSTSANQVSPIVYSCLTTSCPYFSSVRIPAHRTRQFTTLLCSYP